MTTPNADTSGHQRTPEDTTVLSERPLTTLLELDLNRLIYDDKFTRISGQITILIRLLLANPNQLLTHERMGRELYPNPADAPLALRNHVGVIMLRVRDALVRVGASRMAFESIHSMGYVYRPDQVSDGITRGHRMTDCERAVIEAAMTLCKKVDRAEQMLKEACEELAKERADGEDGS